MHGFRDQLLIVPALILFLAVWNSWGPVALLINTIIALIVAGWFGIMMEAGIWSILVLLIGKIPGLAVLIFLGVTGMAFRGRQPSSCSSRGSRGTQRASAR